MPAERWHSPCQKHHKLSRWTLSHGSEDELSWSPCPDPVPGDRAVKARICWKRVSGTACLIG